MSRPASDAGFFVPGSNATIILYLRRTLILLEYASASLQYADE